jgi:hypothetical protein
MKTMLLTVALAMSCYGADATGTWNGTISIPASGDQDARTVPAHLVLKQDGATLTGTAGPDPEQQFPVQNGKVDGLALRFEAIAGEAVMKFVLRQEGDQITGEVSREKEGAPPEVTTISVKRVGKPLAEEIAALDTTLFGAYNNCDLEKFGSLVAADVEFYHDKGGRMDGPKALLDSLKNNICGKVKRELVSGSMNVWPVPGYGAIQEGQHRFSSGGSPFGKPAKFLHVWQNKGGQWKLSRVVSYDH